MKSFFYFVPDRNTLTLADAASVGLAYAFEREIICRQVENGPGGLRGICCVQERSCEDGKNGYHEAKQTWRQIPGSPVWVGHYTHELPGPEDLGRAKQLGGWPLELGGGRWQVPMARAYSEHGEGDEAELRYTVMLPQRLDLAADGRWIRDKVTSRYATLWELAEAWLRLNTATGTPDDLTRFDDQGQVDGAVLCLQANYRLGRIEAAMLGLFEDDTAIIEILDRLIDRPTLDAFTKKKLARMTAAAATPPAGSSLSAGPAVAIPDTGPPVPT